MSKFLCVALLIVAMSASEGMAGRPRLFFRTRVRAYPRRLAPTYHQTYRYLNWRYPKYVGGFHANYFRDLGLPPGDVGLRGNGIYASPW